MTLGLLKLLRETIDFQIARRTVNDFALRVEVPEVEQQWIGRGSQSELD